MNFESRSVWRYKTCINRCKICLPVYDGQEGGEKEEFSQYLQHTPKILPNPVDFSSECVSPRYSENQGVAVIRGKRVLVIDDEVTVLMVLQSCFEELADWEVVTATCGKEGLSKAATEEPDAIVLDLMMPEMDGIEFLRHLKSNPKTEPIPVVLLTAKIELIQSKSYRNYQVVGALAKPFDPMLLVDSVAKLLGWEQVG